MSRYRRASIEGGTFFFTVALADRSSHLLTQRVDHLRYSYRTVQERLKPLPSAFCPTISMRSGRSRLVIPISQGAGI
jgi:putative transposase